MCPILPGVLRTIGGFLRHKPSRFSEKFLANNRKEERGKKKKSIPCEMCLVSVYIKPRWCEDNPTSTAGLYLGLIKNNFNRWQLYDNYLWTWDWMWLVWSEQNHAPNYKRVKLCYFPLKRFFVFIRCNSALKKFWRDLSLVSFYYIAKTCHFNRSVEIFFFLAHLIYI